ncbi:MAG: hypothetical protein D4S01_04030 [Dehalococcoidia bacterium]|nr:MAG: hypothetical protein D4S01_04030 [Dehalococcoidia bacterium]
MECNLYLTPILLALGIATSYTDITRNKIFNKHLVIAFSAAFLVYVYLFISNKLPYSPYLIINPLVAILIAYLMYLTKAWSAGDAKLFIVYSMLIPASRYFAFFKLSCIALFVNIILISTAGIIFALCISIIKNHRILYDIKILKDLVIYMIRSFLTLYALTWVIEPVVLKLNLRSSILVMLIYFAAYYIIFTVVALARRFKLILAFLFISGFSLRYLFAQETFTLKYMLAYLNLAVQYALIFGLIGIVMNKLKPLEEKSKIPLALFMFIGALSLNGPLIHWVMRLLYLLRK